MKTFDEAQAFFTNELHGFLLPLEEIRLAYVKKIKRRLYIAFIMVVPLLIGVFTMSPFLIFISIFSLMIGLGFANETLGKMKAVLQAKFKSDILPPFLEFLFDRFDYLPNQRIAKSVILKSLLISDIINKVVGEDFMRFKLGETGIMFCETTVYPLMIRRNGPIFEGVFLVASFNKNFVSQTLIFPKDSISFVNKTQKNEAVARFERVKLEDPDFNKAFAVYSTDQVESRYILSTSLMQRILAYSQKINRKVSFSFVDDMMFCAIPNYDSLFEPALFNSFFDFEFMTKSYNALKLYTDIVEDLNLNVRIWTKQAKTIA